MEGGDQDVKAKKPKKLSKKKLDAVKAAAAVASAKYKVDAWHAHEKRKALEEALLANLKAKMPMLEGKLAEYSGHWGYEDPIYRFYHGSFKVFYLQSSTKDIVDLLVSCAPTSGPMEPINEDFKRVYEAARAVGDFQLEYNRDWHGKAGPVVAAFLHAKYFLEMAVRYGKELESAPDCLPSGWAAFLYFYNMR